MTRVKKFLTVLAVAVAVVGAGTAPALADSHLPGPLPVHLGD
ncbi:hypothetical protein V1L54_02965 [Streptomyces sp. TRM 70361]|nr:hypothetical protein [Streptomyces sp. TRM 70361]MEE1938382.1 hypothetical protein [Streptomyces sp. TRM 70361]